MKIKNTQFLKKTCAPGFNKLQARFANAQLNHLKINFRFLQNRKECYCQIIFFQDIEQGRYSPYNYSDSGLEGTLVNLACHS